MLQPRSILKVADNSGAKKVALIGTLAGVAPRAASLGDVVVVSVKEVLAQSLIKKKTVTRAVIIRTKNPVRRPDGTTIRFDDNACVVINPDGSLRGTRVFGPVARELRERGFSRIISKAAEVV